MTDTPERSLPTEFRIQTGSDVGITCRISYVAAAAIYTIIDYIGTSRVRTRLQAQKPGGVVGLTSKQIIDYRSHSDLDGSSRQPRRQTAWPLGGTAHHSMCGPCLVGRPPRDAAITALTARFRNTRVQKMKITDVEAIYVRSRRVRQQCDSGQDALIVRVHTDEGITGIGEVDSAPLAAQGIILGPYSHSVTSGLKQLLVGEDPFATEYLWDKMFRQNIYGGRFGVGLHAMSGIDIALWDIKGKKLGMPIWKLLGGGFREKIRCYASVLFEQTPEATAETARRLSDQGFTAVKFGWGPMGESAHGDVQLVAKARAGLGDGVDLLVDAGMVWDSKTAIQRARAFSDYNIFWLEEPLMPDDYAGYRKLSHATETRIAAGEEESGRSTFRHLIVDGDIDVVQVDVTRCGGFTEAMKIASMAADHRKPIANHGFTTYINVAAALHLLNAVPNALIAEYVAQDHGGSELRDCLTRQKICARDGYLTFPQEPGLGVDLNEDALNQLRVT